MSLPPIPIDDLPEGGVIPAPAAAGVGEQLLSFRLGAEVFIIPIETIVEILRWRPVTPVPHAHPVVHGVLSLRGRIITVLDGRRRLGLAAPPPDARSRIIVMRDGDEPVGVLVDEVRDVLRLPADAVQPVPPGVGAATERGIAGVCDRGGDELLVRLDPARFLAGDGGL